MINAIIRRNLTPEQKKYLIGKQYEAEKMSKGGDRKSELAKSNLQSEDLKKDNRTVLTGKTSVEGRGTDCERSKGTANCGRR